MHCTRRGQGVSGFKLRINFILRSLFGLPLVVEGYSGEEVGCAFKEEVKIFKLASQFVIFNP